MRIDEIDPAGELPSTGAFLGETLWLLSSLPHPGFNNFGFLDLLSKSVF